MRKWLFLLFWSLPVLSFSAPEDLTQLISDARTLVLDASNANRQRFSDSQITEFLNEGQKAAMTQSHCLENSLIFQLTPGVTFYAMPSNFDFVDRLTLNGLYLQEMTPKGLDGRSRGWEYSSGYPTYYFINFSTPAYIGFAPFPEQSTDTGTVKVDYFIQANDLVNGTDYPFNASPLLSEYDHALAYFAAGMMYAIDNQPQSTIYMNVFTSLASGLKQYCMYRPNYSPSAIAAP